MKFDFLKLVLKNLKKNPWLHKVKVLVCGFILVQRQVLFCGITLNEYTASFLHIYIYIYIYMYVYNLVQFKVLFS